MTALAAFLQRRGICGGASGFFENIARSCNREKSPRRFHGKLATFAESPWTVRRRVRHVRGIAVERPLAGSPGSRGHPGPVEVGFVTFAGSPSTCSWWDRQVRGAAPDGKRDGPSRYGMVAGTVWGKSRTKSGPGSGLGSGSVSVSGSS